MSGGVPIHNLPPGFVLAPLPKGAQEWQFGLCDCFGDGCGTCMRGCCCIELTWSTARDNAYPGVDSPCCNKCAACCSGGCAFVFWRGEIRHAYGIEGNFLIDALVTTCCLPCSAIQALRQSKIPRVAVPAPPIITEGMQAPQPLQYIPQQQQQQQQQQQSPMHQQPPNLRKMNRV